MEEGFENLAFVANKGALWYGNNCEKIFVVCNKKLGPALTGVAQWVGRHPINRKVAGSIPSQGTCLGCGPGFPVRHM